MNLVVTMPTGRPKLPSIWWEHRWQRTWKTRTLPSVWVSVLQLKKDWWIGNTVFFDCNPSDLIFHLSPPPNQPPHKNAWNESSSRIRLYRIWWRRCRPPTRTTRRRREHSWRRGSHWKNNHGNYWEFSSRQLWRRSQDAALVIRIDYSRS